MKLWESLPSQLPPLHTERRAEFLRVRAPAFAKTFRRLRENRPTIVRELHELGVPIDTCTWEWLEAGDGDYYGRLDDVMWKKLMAAIGLNFLDDLYKAVSKSRETR